jgi:hypothetical protein
MCIQPATWITSVTERGPTPYVNPSFDRFDPGGFPIRADSVELPFRHREHDPENEFAGGRIEIEAILHAYERSAGGL